MLRLWMIRVAVIVRWGIRRWGIWGRTIPGTLLDKFTSLYSKRFDSLDGRGAWGRRVSGPNMLVYQQCRACGIYIVLTHMYGRARAEGLGEAHIRT